MTEATVIPRGMSRADRQHTTNELLAQAQAAPAAERERLINEVVIANMAVAKSVASRYRDRGIPSEDLEQIAYLALVRAAGRFDPDKAEDFLTYAVPTIRGEVKRYFRDHGWMVRPPRRIQEVQAAVSAETARAEAPAVTADDLADRLGLPPDDVREALQANGCFRPALLDTGVEATSPSHWLAADDHEQDAAEARVLLRTLVKELAPRDRLILYLRFFEGRTQAEIGEELGVTQMQVSRLLSRILRDLRARADRDAGRVA